MRFFPFCDSWKEICPGLESPGVPAALPLTFEQLQPLDDVGLHLLVGVPGGKEFAKVVLLQLDLLRLIGFFLRHDLIDGILVEKSFL